MVPSLLLVAALLAQEPAAPADDQVRLERIRRALAEATAVTMAPPVSRDGLVFRVTVHAPKPEKPLWDDWSHVPSYIRPNMPLYHYEFMQQVTPEEFRAGTFATVGLPVGQLLELLGRQISIAHRKSQEAGARQEVRRALEEVLACRAEPSRPGC